MSEEQSFWTTAHVPPFNDGPKPLAGATLPLEILESVIATAQRLHPGNLKPRDREMLAIAAREVESVRGMVGVITDNQG